MRRKKSTTKQDIQPLNIDTITGMVLCVMKNLYHKQTLHPGPGLEQRLDVPKSLEKTLSISCSHDIGVQSEISANRQSFQHLKFELRERGQTLSLVQSLSLTFEWRVQRSCFGFFFVLFIYFVFIPPSSFRALLCFDILFVCVRVFLCSRVPVCLLASYCGMLCVHTFVFVWARACVYVCPCACICLCVRVRMFASVLHCILYLMQYWTDRMLDCITKLEENVWKTKRFKLGVRI